MRRAVVSGISARYAPVHYWPFFPCPLVTVPDVCAEVNWAQFLSHCVAMVTRSKPVL